MSETKQAPPAKAAKVKKRRPPQCLWLIKRGPQSEFHKAPFHPVVICSRQHVYRWERGNSNAQSSAWFAEEAAYVPSWLTIRHLGFDVDYGTSVQRIALWDGGEASFCHDRQAEPWTLLVGAVWWSEQPMPQWLADAGAIYPPDDFTKNAIWNDLGGCLLPMSRQEKLDEAKEELGVPEWLRTPDNWAGEDE